MNIAVIGQKYEGKSTLALVLAVRLRYHHDGYKVLVFDPKWTYKNTEPRIDGHTVRLAYTEDISRFRELVFESERESSVTGEPEPDVVCFRPGINVNDDEVVDNAFTDFCEAINLEQMLRHPPERPLIILVDEASLLQEGRNVHVWLSTANRLATKDKLYIIQAVHAPKEISPALRRELDEIFLFRQNEPIDLDAITERCGPEASALVANLPLHHVLIFDAKARTYKVWDNPEVWYTDIGKENGRGQETDSEGATGA